MTINITLLAFLTAAVILLLYLTVTQYRRAENATTAANTLLQNLQEIRDYITETTGILNEEHLKSAFEADDEVGTFFKQLQDIQKVLDETVPNYEKTEA